MDLKRKAERQVDNTVSKDELNVLTLSILRYPRYINITNQDINRFFNIGKDQTLNFLFNYKRLY